MKSATLFPIYCDGQCKAKIFDVLIVNERHLFIENEQTYLSYKLEMSVINQEN